MNPMKQIQMEANLRKATGKGPMGRLRKQGIVPAVLYGKSETSVNLEVNMKEVNQAIHTSAGTNILVKLNIQGGEAPKEETVMIKALQRHPVTSQLVHVDLIKVSMDKPLETSIPVIISGIARGIKEGGILEVVHREIAIRCLPALIPENITVDVTNLMIGDAITVASLPVVEGVEILVDAHEPVVHVAALLPP
jgi:large subunit ribosomal protein L25